jgi:hypothetical protein
MSSSSNDRNWPKRRAGATRKVHQLWLRFRVRAVLLLERNGVLYVYRTDENFAGPLPGPVLPVNLETPDDFVMEADEEPEVMDPEKEKKSWPGRRDNAMKKVHELWRDFHAKGALVLEKGGGLYVYQSHNDFPKELPLHGSTVAIRRTPRNYISRAAGKKRATEVAQGVPVPLPPPVSAIWQLPVPAPVAPPTNTTMETHALSAASAAFMLPSLRSSATEPQQPYPVAKKGRQT